MTLLGLKSLRNQNFQTTPESNSWKGFLNLRNFQHHINGEISSPIIATVWIGNRKYLNIRNTAQDHPPITHSWKLYAICYLEFILQKLHCVLLKGKKEFARLNMLIISDITATTVQIHLMIWTSQWFESGLLMIDYKHWPIVPPA